MESIFHNFGDLLTSNVFYFCGTSMIGILYIFGMVYKIRFMGGGCVGGTVDHSLIGTCNI